MKHIGKKTFIGDGQVEVDPTLNYLIITLQVKTLSAAEAKLLHGRHAKVQVEV